MATLLLLSLFLLLCVQYKSSGICQRYTTKNIQVHTHRMTTANRTRDNQEQKEKKQ